MDVRVILDGYGSSMGGNSSTMERKFLDSMIKAGINVRVRKFRLLHLDHRKVMVMDDGAGGLVGYTGGMNIGDDYQLNWHDQQTRITGPANWRLHKSFIDDWKQITGEDVAEAPTVPSVGGGARVHVITHVGGLTDQNIKKAYLLAINTARELIRIEDPYFTNQMVIKSLVRAAKRGVKVQLIVPLKDDMQATLHSFRCRYPRMLKVGIEIYEYQPRMEHMKVAVMDHFWATVGSSNLDPQSLKFNNELNLIILDKAFAAEMDQRIFEADIAKSQRITSYSRKLNDILPRIRPFN